MGKEMNLAFGVNFDLLKTNLSAIYEKDDAGSRVLLLPTKLDSSETVSLGEMIDDFKKVLGMKEEESPKIEESLKALNKQEGQFDLNKLTFQLQSAFFYKDMPKQGDGETEYALAISVNMENALPDFGFIKLNKLSIAVWNTDKKIVLEKFGGYKIDKMLEKLKE